MDHCLLQELLEGYRLHDLVLEYLQLTIKMDGDSLAKDAAARQARYLSRLGVLKEYSDGGECASGGVYYLVGLWGSVVKLDPLLKPEECYTENLTGVTQTEYWLYAGHLLRLLVRYVCVLSTILTLMLKLSSLLRFSHICEIASSPRRRRIFQTYC